MAHILISYVKERGNNSCNCEIDRTVDYISILPNFRELSNDKSYYLLLKSYHTMVTNPLQDRLAYVKAKFDATKNVGVTSSSGAVTGMGYQPIPLVRRASILLTPYPLGKNGTSITGDSIPFFSEDSTFKMTGNGGILGAVISRLGPLGLRNFPVYQEKPAKAQSPASSSTSANMRFYGAVSAPTKSQELNRYLSGRKHGYFTTTAGYRAMESVSQCFRNQQLPGDPSDRS